MVTDIFREDGKILECVCDCVAGQGKCSHTAGLLYKIKDATARGLTGVACTDTVCSSQNNWTAYVLKKTKEKGEHFAPATTAYGDQHATSVATHGKSRDSSNSAMSALLYFRFRRISVYRPLPTGLRWTEPYRTLQWKCGIRNVQRSVWILVCSFPT